MGAVGRLEESVTSTLAAWANTGEAAIKAVIVRNRPGDARVMNCPCFETYRTIASQDSTTGYNSRMVAQPACRIADACTCSDWRPGPVVRFGTVAQSARAGCAVVTCQAMATCRRVRDRQGPREI